MTMIDTPVNARLAEAVALSYELNEQLADLTLEEGFQLVWSQLDQLDAYAAEWDSVTACPTNNALPDWYAQEGYSRITLRDVDAGCAVEHWPEDTVLHLDVTRKGHTTCSLTPAQLRPAARLLLAMADVLDPLLAPVE